MNIFLAPYDVVQLNATKSILHKLYAGQLAIDNYVMEGTEIDNAIRTIDIVIEKFSSPED